MTVLDGRVRLGVALNSSGAVRMRSGLLVRPSAGTVATMSTGVDLGGSCRRRSMTLSCSANAPVASEKANSVAAPRVIVTNVFGGNPDPKTLSGGEI